MARHLTETLYLPTVQLHHKKQYEYLMLLKTLYVNRNVP